MRIVGNNPQLSRQTQGTASGSITGGKPVIVNTDGTVGITTAESTVTQSVGSQVTFENALTAFTSTVFDSNAGKIVIAYEDDANSDYGTAIVGTVSGTSISFGSAAIFESAAVSYVAAAFDSNSNKVVISYVDQGNSYYGTAIVGTVSGTSISFGTPVVYESGGTVAHNNITFDSTNNKVVIAYRDDGNSFYGTAIVGTVSGTGISFGTAAVFESAESGEITLDFDSSNGKVVIAYVDGGDGNKPKAVVGTVSGTGISFGTAVNIDTGTGSANLTMAFDSNSNRIVISYMDGNNSNYGTAIVGTVSGTTISFGTAVAYNSGTNGQTTITFDSNVNKVAIMHRDQSDSSDGKLIVGTVDPSDNSISFGSSTTFNSGYTRMYPSASAFDSTNNKVVVAYRDTGESNIGNAIVFQIGGTTTSNALTSENFIGFAEDTVADGQTVTINTKGAIDENQSSLTPAQQYFVQNDGTLGTSADDPSVVAGTAVTATKLIVKG